MADKLTIRIDVDQANNTFSRFAVDEGGQVTFHNDATAEATVTFSNQNALCQGNTPVPSVTIPAGDHKKLMVCSGTAGQEVKYTTTVAGAGTEDPIFIIERKMTGPISYSTTELLVTGAAVLVAAYVGYRVGKRQVSTPKVSDVK